MPIYFFITKDRHCDGYYEAPTRGKAKYMFCEEHWLEFTTPVETHKVVDCEECENEGYSHLGECPTCQGKSYRPDDMQIYRDKV